MAKKKERESIVKVGEGVRIASFIPKTKELSKRKLLRN